MRRKVLTSPETSGSNPHHRQMTRALILLGVCSMVFSAGFQTRAQTSAGKQQEKIVARHFALANEPVEIIEPSVKSRAVELGRGFEAEPDWLRYVTFKVKNRSDKAITFVGIDFDFPETTAAAGAMMMHQVLLGQRPDFPSTMKNPPLLIKPNETIEISLELEHRAIKTLIELRLPSVENINKLVIRTTEMMFEDGTLYSGGFLFERNPDPTGTHKWLRMGEAPITWRRQ